MAHRIPMFISPTSYPRCPSLKFLSKRQAECSSVSWDMLEGSNTPVVSSTFLFHSIYGTTAPPGPWSPSEDASILLYLLLFSSILFFPRICDVSLQTTYSHLVLGFPTGLVLWNFPLRTFIGIHSSSILIKWPVHLSLLILILHTIFRSLYKL
jgi:hypothetical protein